MFWACAQNYAYVLIAGLYTRSHQGTLNGLIIMQKLGVFDLYVLSNG